MGTDIRKLALNILCEGDLAGKYINLALSSHKTDKLTQDERASLTALIYTTTEQRLKYDYYISSLAGREIDKINSYTKNVLRLGLCQIVAMHSIPDFAAVNETVKLARNPGERAFVNGILRAAVRQKAALPMPSEEKNYKRYLSVKYSFPLWIVKALDLLYGREETEKLLDFYNNAKYTDLTVNTTVNTVSEYIRLLSDAGYETALDSDTGLSVRINRSVNPERLPGFEVGAFLVQDKASLVSALALGAKEGELIIDTCACPGGKSFATAIITNDKADIRSHDLHESKLSLITGGAQRLSLTSISARVLDATEPDETLFGKADRVLCDVPCSGLGVLGKKADIRYKSQDDITSLPALQYKILESSAKYLKAGGVITYSTCTLLPAENGEVVDRFLSEHEEFCPVDFEIGSLRSEGARLTMLPSRHGTDGFFIAKLKRLK